MLLQQRGQGAQGGSGLRHFQQRGFGLAAYGRARGCGLSQGARCGAQFVGGAAKVGHQGLGGQRQGPGLGRRVTDLRSCSPGLGGGLADLAQGGRALLQQRVHGRQAAAGLGQGVLRRAGQRAGLPLQRLGQLLQRLRGLRGTGQGLARLRGGQQLARGRGHCRQIPADLPQVQAFQLGLQSLQTGGRGGNEGQAGSGRDGRRRFALGWGGAGGGAARRVRAATV